MEIEELMINDWVQVPSEMNRYKRVRSTFDIDSAVLYRPIPLTEKILEYNFATEPQISWCVGWNRKDDIHIEIKREDINAAFYGVIAYVHQLQHALAICGIDKEIVLT